MNDVSSKYSDNDKELKLIEITVEAIHSFSSIITIKKSLL